MPAAATSARWGAAAVGLVMVCAGSAAAQSDAGGRVDVYIDDQVVIVAPAASVGIDPPGPVELEITWQANILSGATPLLTADVISSATHFEDVRHAVDLALRAQPDPLTTLSGSVRGSLELDYAVASATVGVQREIAERMASLSASYTALFEHAWTSHHDGVRQSSITHRLDVGATVILSKSTRLALQASGIVSACGDVLGCQANPYRFVLVDHGAGRALAVRELHPDTRGRVALKVALSQALGRHVALHGDYRFYVDSWRVLGHTANLDVGLAFLEERLLLRIGGRLTRQTAASFFATDYSAAPDTVPGVRSGDRELSGLWAIRAGGRVEWAWLGVGPFLRLAISARLNHTWYRYPDFPWQPRRNAWVAGLGVDLEY